MSFRTVTLETADAEVINAYAAEAPLGEECGGLFGNVNELFVEAFLLPETMGTSRFEKEPFAFSDLMPCQLIDAHTFGVFDFNHPGGANRGLQRHGVQGFAPRQEMERSIHVSAGV